MLRSLKEIVNYVLLAKDGEIGRCNDFLFDDESWTVRYMVADTGRWLPGRKVLISPISLGDPDWMKRQFPVNLTQAQIETSPALDENAPVSRRYEQIYFTHFNWPYYWTGADRWGATPIPPAPPAEAVERLTEKESDPEKTHLRSMKEVKGYYIGAKDGNIGHVEDFIVEDETWAIRYLVVDTRNWLPGRKVLVSPEWIASVTWVDNTVAVNLTKEQVEESPEYDPARPINREYELRLYDFYGRPAYWK